MNKQEQDKAILEGAPEGATHWDGAQYYKYEKHDWFSFLHLEWISANDDELYTTCSMRDLSDIRELVELRAEVAELKEELSKSCESFTKTMEFAYENNEPDFLHCWLEGDWDSCREWTEEYDLDPSIFYPELSTKGDV